MEKESIIENGVSRRSFLASSGKVLAGAALASAAISVHADNADAYPYTAKGYKYVKLDPKKVGKSKYENYFKNWCTSSVIAGLVEHLAKNAGGAWKEYPVDAMRWAHGGLAGWGALCGTLVGAGTIIGLATNETDIAEAMVNDLAFYYSYTELPSFTPAKVLKAELSEMTIAGTPVCHISVGRWMRAADESFLSDERAERCARVSANVAMEATRMLNLWSAGNYKPKHKPLYNLLANGITSQNNCTDCHGRDVPAAESYNSLAK